MFTQVHLLPQATNKSFRELKERWETKEGHTLHDKILAMIIGGAGEDFLQYDFQQGQLGFLEHEHDLRGFKFWTQNITFPHNDTFENIDFSYGEFWHSNFENGMFYCTMDFTTFLNCGFDKCSFHFNNCYACLFERVRFNNCDFIQNNTFTNCVFRDCQFNNTFFSNSIFIDCRFDSQTTISELPKTPVSGPWKIKLENRDKSNLYSGIKEAYSAGGVITESRRYLYRQLKEHTRHNSRTVWEKVVGYLSEFLIGYGLRPFRPILIVFLFFLSAFGLFTSSLPPKEALFLTCGALLTFGAKVDLLNSFNIWYHVLYVMTAFVGISGLALFITVFASVLRRHD